MCFASAPSTPAPPPLPPPVPPPPQPVSQDVTRARERNRTRSALAQGRSSTILTSGLGLTTPATTVPKTVLGG